MKLIHILITLLLLLPGLCEARGLMMMGGVASGEITCTLGNNVYTPTSTGTHTAGVYMGNLYDAALCSGTIVSGHYYNDAAATVNIMVCLYPETSNTTLGIADDNPICSNQTVCEADRWCALTFNAGSISSSTDYWIGAVKRDTGDGIYNYASTGTINRTIYSDGVCDPYDADGDIGSCSFSTTSSRSIAVYVTVQP